MGVCGRLGEETARIGDAKGPRGYFRPNDIIHRIERGGEEGGKGGNQE